MYLDLMILVVVVVAAVSHYRAGVWAGMLTLWSAAVAGGVAFGFYPLLSGFLFGRWSDVGQTGYFAGDGVSLLLLFFAAFGVLLVVAGRFLRNSLPLRAYLDVGGGAALGALGGYLAGGVLAVAAQMMPLPPTSVLGYEPFDMATGQRTGHLTSRADDVVLGLYNTVLGNAFSAREGNLAARYPVRDLKAAAMASRPFRGTTADDILYHCFRRRVEHALWVGEGLGPYETKSGKSVQLKAGAKGLSTASSKAPAVSLFVHQARVAPRVLVCAPGGAVSEFGPKDFEWTRADGAVVEKDKISPDYGLLLVEVSFKPEKNEPLTLSLDEWSLESSFNWSENKPKALVPKLCGPAKSAAGGAGRPTPLAALAEKDVAGLLDDASVEIENKAPAAGLEKGADTLFFARNAAWAFEGNQRQARATLVFLVPQVTAPWQYGLLYRSKTALPSSSERQEGLFRGFKQTQDPIQLTVQEVGPRQSALSDVNRQAAKENELLVVKLNLKATKPVLLTPKDLVLVNTVLGQEYAGELLEEAVGEEEAKKSSRKMRGVEILAGPESAAPAAEPATGRTLTPGWQVFFAEKYSNAEITLVFEAPRGKPFTQYRFKIAENLGDEPPDWYLRRHPQPINSRNHEAKLAKIEWTDTIPQFLSSGAVRDFKVPAASNAELVVLTLTLTPKKEEDKGYYLLNLSDVGLRATKGVGQDIPLHSVRLKGTAGFRRPKDKEVFAFQGEYEIQLTFYVTKQLGEMRFAHKTMNFSEKIEREE